MGGRLSKSQYRKWKRNEMSELERLIEIDKESYRQMQAHAKQRDGARKPWPWYIQAIVVLCVVSTLCYWFGGAVDAQLKEITP